MELLKESLVVIHLAGMAVLVGAFIVNMKRKSDFPFTAMMWAAIVQLATGTLLVGLEYALDDAPDNAKITVKAILATGQGRVETAALLPHGRWLRHHQPHHRSAVERGTLGLVP
jgi:hypothetical protein